MYRHNSRDRDKNHQAVRTFGHPLEQAGEDLYCQVGLQMLKGNDSIPPTPTRKLRSERSVVLNDDNHLPARQVLTRSALGRDCGAQKNRDDCGVFVAARALFSFFGWYHSSVVQYRRQKATSITTAYTRATITPSARSVCTAHSARFYKA